MRFSSNFKQFSQGLDKHRKECVAELRVQIVATARFAHQSLIDKTPVWEGKTVRNYIMTLNSPFSGEYEEIGGGPTGRTSQMSLGSEPRRNANASAALATGAVLKEANCFSNIFISNNTDTAAGLEMGQLPGEGYSSRSPQGMFAITLQEAAARLKAKQL